MPSSLTYRMALNPISMPPPPSSPTSIAPSPIQYFEGMYQYAALSATDLLDLFELRRVCPRLVKQQLPDVLNGVSELPHAADLIPGPVCGARIRHGVAVIPVSVHL